MKTERLLVRLALSKCLKHMKGDGAYAPKVTAQVENKSLPTTPQCGSQLAKPLFVQVINFKKSDCCQTALHTYVLKNRQYHAALCFISLPQFEHHVLLRSCLPLCPQRDLTADGPVTLAPPKLKHNQLSHEDSNGWGWVSQGFSISAFSQPVPPFVWPNLTPLHHSTGFIVPDSLLLQGTMWEAQQSAPHPWYTTTRIVFPVGHQEAQSITTGT